MTQENANGIMKTIHIFMVVLKIMYELNLPSRCKTSDTKTPQTPQCLEQFLGAA